MNDFKIVISAVDKATATVKKINDSFSRSTRGVTNLGRSTAALGRELGLPRFAKNVGAVGAGISGVVDKMFSLRTLIAGSAVGGALIGIESIAAGWGRAGEEISRTSATLGISMGQLQSYRGAAQLAGVSTDDLTGGIKALGDTMEDALYGRNQQALALLNRLGISVHRTKDGAIDTARGFDDLARAISRIKSPQVQGLVARNFGVEALLPLMRKGPAGIASYRKQVAELGGVMSDEQIARAEKFGLSLHMLSIAGRGLYNTIGDKLIPIMQPLVVELTGWISANRELIATRLGNFLEGIATWVKETDFKKIGEDVVAFAEKVNKVVEFLGGWKIVALGVATAMAGPFLLSLGKVAVALTAFALTPAGMVLMALAAGLKIGEIIGPPGYDDTHRPAAPGGDVRAMAHGNPGRNLLAAGRGSDKVQVDVNFRNAPPGTRADIAATSGVSASGRIEHAMPGVP